MDVLSQVTTLPRQAVLVAAGAGVSTVQVAGDVAAYTVRVATKVETLLDEAIALLQETRPLVQQAAPLVPRVSATLDGLSAATVHVDDVVGVVATLPQTQNDVRVAVETLQTLVGLANLGIAQIESIPGARLVRRRITKALSEQQTGRL